MNAEQRTHPDTRNSVAGRRQDSATRIATCIAVDWSGSLSSVRSRLWLAESRDEKLVRVECGFDRTELVRHLVECAEREPNLVVGLDFAFSFPLWFVEQLAARDSLQLWDIVARDGEGWLEHCPHPFWGKPFMRCPPAVAGRSPWRVTETEHLLVGGIGPKSIFQIGGAGSVGTGSLRGMPHLRTLRDAGFSIWPFDEARLPMVVEIYPRYLTGPVNKSSAIARALYLQAHHAGLDRKTLDLAGSTEDAFDAAVSAACMQRFAHDFQRLAHRPRNAVDLVEGRIWSPLRDPLFERW